MQKSKRQTGLTLVELLVGMLVGMIVMAGAISIFSNSFNSQSDNIQLTRLNQDLRAMMDIMERDIRRAGFVTSDPDNNFASLQANPFFDSATGGATTDIGIYNSGACIVYSYNSDNDSPPVVDSNERRGFLLDGTNLEMRKYGATNENCSTGAEWETITDPGIEITALQFTLTTSTLNVTSMINDDDGDGTVEPSDSDGIPYGDDDGDGLCDWTDTNNDGVRDTNELEVCNTCTRDGSPPDPACLYVRNVTISLTGRLANDTAVTQTITEEIRIRNDKFVAAVP
ncbi:hypothetical protein AU255_02680 [Methyloprofundus sedimenti]|uniref:Pilus assembly protein PilW n=1 Tax=Methyloprofundus sedimenti TaxID=1420851 RepID=A0A1V8M5J3_9GAMM|nr:prepilin-type N-terminal cleavage/methylation domain-containing protein [Methyloprofundus sedimenti]OQK16827.1 hypothetical protein AU255_02680 [Methyloprofundus sedimenti]